MIFSFSENILTSGTFWNIKELKEKQGENENENFNFLSTLCTNINFISEEKPNLCWFQKNN